MGIKSFKKRFKKCLLSGAVLLVALLIPSFPSHADWEYDQEEHILRYKKEDGTYLASTFQKINGYTYYFNSDGTVHTGWLKLNGKCYFFSESGAMLKNQWVGDKYLLKNGQMARSRWVANHTAYVNKNGTLVTSGKKYRAKFIKTKKGVKYRNADGSFSAKTWQRIQGHWYYFYSTGFMARDRQLGDFYVNKKGRMLTNGSVKIGKRRYYYGADGRLVKSVKIKNKSQNKAKKKNKK